MAAQSKDFVSLRLRLGWPKDGDFIGLTLDHRLTSLHIVLGGAIAIGIVWIIKSKNTAAPDAVSPPTDIALARESKSLPAQNS